MPLVYNVKKKTKKKQDLYLGEKPGMENFGHDVSWADKDGYI